MENHYYQNYATINLEQEMLDTVNTSPYLNAVYGDSNNPMARRYSSPQMGYYDLITGEYRYRSEANFNQSSLISNYVGETEPPMCENTCKCCQIRLPFNCLTISFITCLMLLIMFSLFQAILATNTKNPINTTLFSDMIFLMSTLSLIFFILTIIRYICIDRFHICNYGFCQRCKSINAIFTDVFFHDHSHRHRHNNKHHSHGNIDFDEQFV